ncbi:MAG: type II toxin-antitoxin system RelE/ParE family toxin [Nanoarchaeota archaeon]
MVTVLFHPSFKKLFLKIKDPNVKDQVLKQVAKIRDNPEIGKPMRFSRKGTREVYIHSFRLSYLYLKQEEKLVLLDLYHKDER